MDFAFELLVLIIIAMLMGGPGVLLMIPALLVVTLLAGMFAVGLGLILSIATVYFRDLGHLWQIFNQIWMYASGVVFSLNMLDSVQNRLFDAGWQINGAPIPITTIARLNPAETYLEAFRSCLYDFALPSLPVFLACLGWAVVMLSLGLVFFRRTRRVSLRSSDTSDDCNHRIVRIINVVGAGLLGSILGCAGRAH